MSGNFTIEIKMWVTFQTAKKPHRLQMLWGPTGDVLVMDAKRRCCGHPQTLWLAQASSMLQTTEEEVMKVIPRRAWLFAEGVILVTLLLVRLSFVAASWASPWRRRINYLPVKCQKGCLWTLGSTWSLRTGSLGLGAVTRDCSLLSSSIDLPNISLQQTIS